MNNDLNLGQLIALLIPLFWIILTTVIGWQVFKRKEL